MINPNTVSFKDLEHSIAPSKEEITSGEIVQFKDNVSAILLRSIGSVATWGNKHRRPESGNNCTIVSTEAGNRVAVGHGIIAALPELDEKYGRFVGDHAPAEHDVRAIEVANFAPEGLADIVIGEMWPIFNGEQKPSNEKVASVMTRYKIIDPSSPSVMHKVESFSPLESAQELLKRLAHDMVLLNQAVNPDGVGFDMPMKPSFFDELDQPIPGRE